MLSIHIFFLKNDCYWTVFSGEAAIQSIVAHNVHKNVGRTQQGGTSVIMFGPITEQIEHERSGKDNTGLGRWMVMMLQGDGVRT